nr:zinc finger protein 597-like [Parasteatoda tepidariorum]
MHLYAASFSGMGSPACSHLKMNYVKSFTKKSLEECYICGKLCDNRRILSHIRTHTNVEVHECQDCGFYAPAEYDRHYIIHANVKPYICHICHKGFSQCGHLKKHYICHVKKEDQYLKQKGNYFDDSVNESKESGNKKTCKKVAENIHLINKQVKSCDDNLINGVNENCDDDLINELNENCDNDLINDLNENCDDNLINELNENCDDLTNELEGKCDDLANVLLTNCDDNLTNDQNINCDDNLTNKFEENLCKINSKYELKKGCSNKIVRNNLQRKDCTKDVLTVYDQINYENIFNISKKLSNVHDDDILDVKLNKNSFIKSYDF